MKPLLRTSLLVVWLSFYSTLCAQQTNDTNTPLHLTKPSYEHGYGIPSVDEVKATTDRILRYLNSVTPAAFVDAHSGRELTTVDASHTGVQLKRGAFRLTSYEWGVTYSAMLAAHTATSDERYREYVVKRHALIAEAASAFSHIYSTTGKIDPLVRPVIDPHSLDDAGSVCCSMIKSLIAAPQLPLRGLVDNYINYIINKEYRLSDGIFARLRPQKNSVWLDDMFMGIPPIAYMGKLTGDWIYFDEAARQVILFAGRMFVTDDNLFRHGWVEEMESHPAFYWGRANGWAILTLCEVLDVLPPDHPRRDEIMALFKAHASGLACLQHHTGFWHQLLDRNDTYLETSSTAIFTYCLAHGVDEGWLDAKVYGPVALLGWHAVQSAVNDEGQVENVCVGTGMGFDAAFYAYRPVNVMAAHGYGPAIWAGAEIIRLLQLQHPKLNDSAVQFYDDEVPTDQPIFNYDGKVRF